MNRTCERMNKRTLSAVSEKRIKSVSQGKYDNFFVFTARGLIFFTVEPLINVLSVIQNRNSISRSLFEILTHWPFFLDQAVYITDEKLILFYPQRNNDIFRKTKSFLLFTFYNCTKGSKKNNISFCWKIGFRNVTSIHFKSWTWINRIVEWVHLKWRIGK